MPNEFNINDKVNCIRHRHGWNDDSWGIVISKDRRSGGSAYYRVKNPDSGIIFEVNHSRDLTLKK